MVMYKTNVLDVFYTVSEVPGPCVHVLASITPSMVGLPTPYMVDLPTPYMVGLPTPYMVVLPRPYMVGLHVHGWLVGLSKYLNKLIYHICSPSRSLIQFSGVGKGGGTGGNCPSTFKSGGPCPPPPPLLHQRYYR